jgi:nucleoside-diphosphate-sugar epimerase
VNILVTGATGFLGSQLVAELECSLHHVFGVSTKGTETTIGCDLNIRDSVKTLVDNCLPDYIIHCAAYVPRKLSDYQDDLLGKSNVLMTQNILDASICPIIYISSMTVYGSSPSDPVYETEVCSPENYYAKSKYDCECMIKESGRPGLAIRIPGLFGMPRQSGLVYNLVSSALTGDDITLPQAPISWAGIHVADAAKRIVNLLPKASKSFIEINIGCSGKTSVNQLIDLVNDIFESNIETAIKHPVFEFDLTRYHSLTSLPASNLRQSLENFGDEIDV